jgi:hypothetical protein
MKYRSFIGIVFLFLTTNAAAQTTTANLSITKPQTGQAQPQVTIATAFDQFDAAIAGRLSKSVAGSSDVTLTTAEARNAIIELTGTLTGNVNLIVPAKNKIYLVYNNSAGAFTLTVKTPAGTGIAVTQGERVWLYCDSTNVVAVTAGGGGGGSGTLSISVTNEGTTGTLANGLAKLTGAPSTAIRMTTSDTNGAIGVVTSGAGAGGTATIQLAGQVACVFENATTAGNYVIPGTGTAGNCRDGGSGYPSSGQAIGRVLTTNGGAGTYTILLFPPEIRGGAGGGGGATTALDNLASVNINSALLAQSGVDLGSTTKPFRELFLYGGGTFGTNYFQFTGTPTAARTITVPNLSGTLGLTAGAQTFSNKTIDNTNVFSGYFDVTRITAPANPSAGNLRLFANNATGKLACLDNAGADCMPAGGGGGGSWDTISAPGGNQSLSMGAFTTTWTWGNSTGANDLFNLTDSTTNSSATGRLVNIATTTGSTLRPFRVAAAGTEAIFTNQLGATIFGSTTAANSLSKVEISGTATDGSGNSLLRLIASGSQGTGLTLQNNTHTWSIINRNNDRLGFYQHANNYALNLSYTNVEALRLTNNNVAGTSFLFDTPATGGRTWVLYSTANSHALGGGNFTIRDESSAANRVRINSSGTIFLGPASPGTAATEGFINLPKTTNQPTGTPGTLVTGYGPLVLEEDTTNSQYLLWGYLNGAWRNLSNGVGRATYTGIGGGSTNINFALYRIHEFTFGAGSETLTFSNIPNGQTITLAIIQDGSGNRLLTWPATAKFLNGTVPTLSTAAGARDIIQFYSDGTNLYQSAPIILDVK